MSTRRDFASAFALVLSVLVINALIVLLIGGCSTSQVEPVRVLLPNDGERAGTAVLVATADDASFWLTNAHVVEGADPREAAVASLAVRSIATVRGSGTFEGIAYVVDAAVLTTSDVSATPAEPLLGKWDPRGGEPVTIETTRGTFAGRMRPRSGGTYLVETDEQIVPGDSGSPVFAEGLLAGLVFASSEQRERVSVVTPLWCIRLALAEHRLAWVVR